MKKITNFLFFLSFILLSEVSKSQYLTYYENKTSTNALLMLALKGKVKSLKQTSFKAIDKDGVVVKEKKANDLMGTINSDFLMLFDDTARVIQENYYDELSVKKFIVNHKYNDVKNIEVIEETREHGEVYGKFIYQYSKGKWTEEDFTQIQNSKIIYTFKSSRKYDDKGKLLETDFTDDRNDNGRAIFKYDNKGYLISQEGYKAKDVIGCKERTYKVDTNGNNVEVNYYKLDCNGIDHKFIYKYDDHNNVIQKEYYYNPADKLFKTYYYKYEYDKTGNWIKRTDFENGKPTYILERQFEYYPPKKKD